MSNKVLDYDTVKGLKDGQSYDINVSGYGVKVVCIGNRYAVYEINRAGDEWYYQSYNHDDIPALVNYAYRLR